MKITKKIVLILIGFVAVFLIIALFLKKEYSVTRTVVIDKPNAEVFQFLKFLKNQDQFSVWNQMDPTMKKSYHGIDGTVGFVAAWESTNEQVGKGEQEIIELLENTSIKTKLRFKTPFEAENEALFRTENLGTKSTKVSWSFQGSYPYPMNMMQLFFSMEDAVGSDLQKGLDNLKLILEKK
ncbi:MAG: SRPBCC family protein [Bacteroidetes bacterium]|nr:SRPBCC family protein [Bacteroidota bacterium]